MALLMEAGSEPQTNEETFDLQAISALNESAAIELKEKGNEYVKKGKKHYSDAIDCYTRAINQKALSELEHSTIYSNRAHVNLLLGNYRRALQDAEEAIRLCPTNVKALYRAVKDSSSLNLLDEAKSYCNKGTQLFPDNEELQKLDKLIDMKKSEHERQEREVSKAVSAAEDLVAALEDRRIKLGKPMYQETHWNEKIDTRQRQYSSLSRSPSLRREDSAPLQWDTKNVYTRDSLELYYEANSGVCLSKKDILSNLRTAASHLEKYSIGETDAAAHTFLSSGIRPKWVKVNERRTLNDILRNLDIVVPGIPGCFLLFQKDQVSIKISSPETGLHQRLHDQDRWLSLNIKRESRAVDTESLCVVAGKWVWSVRIDLHIIDNCGNLVDAANIAALAALLTFRRPECTLGGEDGQEVTLHPPEVKEPLPLIVHHLPIAVTFAFIGNESTVVLEPTHFEEAVMGGRLTATLNTNGDVCAIQKAGGEGVLQSVIMQCLRIASVKAADITDKIKKACVYYSTARALKKIKRHPVSVDVKGGDNNSSKEMKTEDISIDQDDMETGINSSKKHESSLGDSKPKAFIGVPCH
ncbi:hypothetical protein CASFOL_030321 [Castilleja foliolosa]|uniref:Uncharacterized protein n=1 Tax=Castilleja foliolosa TaxID=1961234 RepID=A0ABD3C883_9LAMI